MWFSRQNITPDVIGRLQAAVDSEPDLSRSCLARRLCEWLDWRSPSGKLQQGGARKLIAELDRRGAVKFPPAKKLSFPKSGGATPMAPPPTAHFTGTLAQLGEVELVAVSSRYAKASKQWNAMMDVHHPLGAGPLRGAQIRYLIQSPEHGLLGGLSFSSATARLKERDTRIGWSDAARLANLNKIVQNSRFLIAPTVRVPNLASHVLAKSLAQLTTDWQERYGVTVALVETFVDPARFDGACYKAANWDYVGQTAARSDSFANGRSSSGPKDIYLYPLHDKWFEDLNHEPVVQPRRRNWEANTNDWAECEFGGAMLYDNRLRERVCELARDFFAKPGTPVPETMGGSMAKTKAAYRFFENERVDLQSVLHGHVEATYDRVAKQQVVLAVQDTSSLNYTAHPLTEGLGPINTTKDNGIGMFLHPTLAVTSEGTPLGLLDVQCWARDPDEAGMKKNHVKIPIEEKESYRWLRSYQATTAAQAECPETMLINVGDRESDIYDLFSLVQRTENGPHLLVRADKARMRRASVAKGNDADNEVAVLWETMDRQPVQGQHRVHVPRRGSRKQRVAELEVRFAAVSLQPPKKRPKSEGLQRVEMWAVHAKEVGHDDDTDPLEWMLLTTVPTETVDEALERLHWYTQRWNIEVYFRTLKSGIRIEDRRLGSASSLQTCLAIDLVVAWRVYWLVKQGRETPDIPCDAILEEHEWKTLYFVSFGKPPPDEPPPLREAVRLIAKLGGFLGRKADGEPGSTTVWRGLGRLADMAIIYQMTTQPRSPP